MFDVALTPAFNSGCAGSVFARFTRTAGSVFCLLGSSNAGALAYLRILHGGVTMPWVRANADLSSACEAPTVDAGLAPVSSAHSIYL